MAVFDSISGIVVASGFKLQAKVPLDGRLVADTIEDRDALITENGAYEGMVVYVKEDKTLYKLDGTTTDDWSAIGGDVAADLGELTTRVDDIEEQLDGTVKYTQEEKTKLASIEEGANKTVVDSALSSTSENPVQNKVINTALNGKVPTTRTVNGKPLSANVTLTADDVDAIPSAQKGANNGVAELDENGKVPSAQLPSYVDDVIEGYLSDGKFYEEAGHTTEITGEAGKIYTDLTTNKTYRWGGSAFTEISASLALGETSSTAYRGDRGKIAYEHSQAAHAPSNAERNTVVAVQVNGEDLTPDGSRKVNVEVPTKVSDLENDTGFITDDGTAAKAAQLETARAIDGVNFNGTADIGHYGTCSTAAGTAAKVVALTGFKLVTGSRVTVKFTVTNTAASPTLNVNSTGAKSILYRGSAISAGYLAANRTYEFVYNGTAYELVGDVDTNTTYSAATTSAQGLMSAADKTKLESISADATKVEESETNGNIKIDGAETVVYTHPTTAGNKHIPSGGAANQVLEYDSVGTAKWGHTVQSDVPSNAKFTDTTYSNATQSTDGLMSSEDKTKLDTMPQLIISSEAPVSAPVNSVWLQFSA